MNQYTLKMYALATFIILSLIGNSAAIAGSKNKAPKGFKPFETRQLDNAWINPKFNASDYKTIAIKWSDFDYRPGLDKFSTTDRNENYNLSEESKNLLQEQAQTTFEKYLARSKNFKLVDLNEASSDTLIVQLTLVDVTNKVPDRRQFVTLTNLFLRQFGEATLKVELFDSTQSQLLFKGIDRESINTINFNLERANMINARRYSRFRFERWAKGLRKNIDDLHKIS